VSGAALRHQLGRGHRLEYSCQAGAIQELLVPDSALDKTIGQTAAASRQE
jgi:hypothetical protein